MLGAEGGVEAAVRNRVGCALDKFHELTPILTRRDVSLKLKGKFYRACVQSVLLNDSETCAMKVEDDVRLRRAERAMARWMCGVEEVLNVVRSRLRWFGHAECKECDWVSACRDIKVLGSRGRGRPKKTWEQCVQNDMSVMRFNREMTEDQDLWRSAFHGNRPT